MIEFPAWVARVEQLICFIAILFNVSAAFLALSNSEATQGKGIAHSGFSSGLLAGLLLIASLTERAYRLPNGPLELGATLCLVVLTATVVARLYRTGRWE